MLSNCASADVYRLVAESAQQGLSGALALVLQTQGSTPCKIGAKAFLRDGKVLAGTVGGGFVEAQTEAQAAAAVASQRPVVFEITLGGGTIHANHPICGGSVRLLLDPGTGADRDAYAAAANIRKLRQRGVLLTQISSPTQPMVTVRTLSETAISSDSEFPGEQAIRATLKQGQPQLFVPDLEPEDQRIELLVEPLLPPPRLLIVGGGHVGQAVAAQGSLIGFDLVVIDDRREFTDPSLFPESATIHHGSVAQRLADGPLDQDTYVVIATHSHQQDAEALARCIREPIEYLGMIGSQRKVALMRRELVESGRVTVADFDHVYAPMGLEIGAVTVPEIAASIVAQIIAVRHDRA